MARPTEEELKLLKLFRKNIDDLELTPEQSSDHDLLRWIRARNHNLAKAEDMLRKSIAWRTENKIDSLLSWTAPSDITMRCTNKFEGLDKDNSPILTSFLGTMDLKRIYQLGLREDYMSFSSQLYEKMLEKCRKNTTKDDYPVTQFVLILDMEGFSTATLMSKGAVNMSMDNLRVFEANYPETVKKFVFINANNVTMMMYNLVKPLMSTATMNKFQILGTDSAKWKQALLEIIPEDQLCPRFGGTMKCQSSLCCPEVNGAHYESLTVAAGKQHEHKVTITESGCTLQWSVSLQAHDIKFTILFNNEVVVPEKKIDGNERMEEGSLVCESGIYTFIFNNCHSRFRGKELNLRITVEN